MMPQRRAWDDDAFQFNAKGKGRKEKYKYTKLTAGTAGRAAKLMYGVDKSDPEFAELEAMSKSEQRKLKLRNKEAPYRTNSDGASFLGGQARSMEAPRKVKRQS
jgi:hypothetical protein